KESAVPAIVLDHEQANEQPGGERRQRERQPVEAVTRGDHHRDPECGKRWEGDNELQRRAAHVRLAVRFERERPVPGRPRGPYRFRARHRENSARRAVLNEASPNGRSTALAKGWSG